MVESLVAISVSVIGLLGVLGLLSRSLAINKDVTQKFVATYLAAEGIEIVKSIIDANYANRRPWNNGLSNGNWEAAYNDSRLTPQGRQPNFLYFDPTTGIYNYDRKKNQTPFQRTILIQNVSQGQIKVISRVQWTERGIGKEVKLEDKFFDWRIIQTRTR